MSRFAAFFVILIALSAGVFSLRILMPPIAIEDLSAPQTSALRASLHDGGAQQALSIDIAKLLLEAYDVQRDSYLERISDLSKAVITLTLALLIATTYIAGTLIARWRRRDQA